MEFDSNFLIVNSKILFSLKNIYLFYAGGKEEEDHFEKEEIFGYLGSTKHLNLKALRHKN